MKLRSDFVHHKDFHKGLWLKNHNCPWFFFYQTPREYNIPNNKEFYSTVDPNLLNIVKLLHKKGIPTTPSCSGHIKNPRDYEEIYDSLGLVEKTIKDRGLILSNLETKRKFYYKNPKFSLPYSRNEFLEKINLYQRKGVLGFVDNLGLYENMMNEIPISRDKNIVLIFTVGDSEDKIHNTWKNIYKLISNLV